MSLYLYFHFFLLARFTRIYNTPSTNDLHVFFLCGEIEVVEKKWLPAERTSRFSRPLTKNATDAVSEKDGCMKKCQSTQKQLVF